MFQPLKTIDHLWAGLQYEETVVNWDDLENNLSLIPPGDGKGPPDFYMEVMGNHLPLTKVATSQFGRLSGVKPSIYREFQSDQTLTAKMIHHSMNKADRGGKVYVAHTAEQIVGFYSFEKSFLGLETSFGVLRSVPGFEYGEMYALPDGTFEFTAILGDLTQSVTPGLFMAHGGRPAFGVYSVLHDRSCVLGPLKAAKKKKTNEASESAAADFVAGRANEAFGESDRIYKLAKKTIPDPVKFISRLSLMNGFSVQASDKAIQGAAGALAPNSSHYDVVRYVASIATGEKIVDRRFQQFAHYIGFRGADVCNHCGLPE